MFCRIKLTRSVLDEGGSNLSETSVTMCQLTRRLVLEQTLRPSGYCTLGATFNVREFYTLLTGRNSVILIRLKQWLFP